MSRLSDNLFLHHCVRVEQSSSGVLPGPLVTTLLRSPFVSPATARATPPMKTAPPGSKTLKLLSSLSHVPALTVESPAQHTAPLYESEEL